MEDHSYKVDDLVSYEGIVYICISAHVSNSGWKPPTAFTLWVPYALRAKRR
ncbi:carbohydrate-binding protein [Pseudomonas viridiflava]|uniref:carbohydrate-binding protein n=1 Tax=Pseudomonas viridiflava TaxID=33069 RepID=UPI00311E4A37